MRFVSTRQNAPETDLENVILEGLAPDGGLYVPVSVPQFLTNEFEALKNTSFPKLASIIFGKFLSVGRETDEVCDIVANAYTAFSDPEIAPLVQLDDGLWVMELFHGPTYAFKDLALQVLAPLMDFFLQKQDKELFVLCATSGDTGGAALASLNSIKNVRALVLYPEGGVSKFQEQQMLNLSSSSCRAIPVRGSFDDCQRLVKELLGNQQLRQSYGLTAVNSVNWGRILAQAVYYARASLELSKDEQVIDFVVPTGNFGNAYSGLLAKRMGFPVGLVWVANNENDTLHKALENGTYNPGRTIKTNTPAMDIQSPSNFERFIFDNDGTKGKLETRTFINQLAKTGKSKISEDLLSRIRYAVRSQTVEAADTARQIASIHSRTGYMVDPHTALALRVSEEDLTIERPRVVLATAHPIKFSETVHEATGLSVDPPTKLTFSSIEADVPASITPSIDAVFFKIAEIYNGS